MDDSHSYSGGTRKMTYRGIVKGNTVIIGQHIKLEEEEDFHAKFIGELYFKNYL